MSGATVSPPRLTGARAATGVAVGAGVGLALGTLVGAGLPLSAWVVIGIGAGVAISAARDERARPVLVRPGRRAPR